VLLLLTAWALLLLLLLLLLLEWRLPRVLVTHHLQLMIQRRPLLTQHTRSCHQAGDARCLPLRQGCIGSCQGARLTPEGLGQEEEGDKEKMGS
jgi:hypothetical protein